MQKYAWTGIKRAMQKIIMSGFEPRAVSCRSELNEQILKGWQNRLKRKTHIIYSNALIASLFFSKCTLCVTEAGLNTSPEYRVLK